MVDGRISVSPFDTAFVCVINDLEGRNAPQFPSSLEWIAKNQLSDGSWGDEHFYLAYDRLLNTLACVVSLRAWRVHADKSEKVSLSKFMISPYKYEMTCGFEIIFPVLLRRARDLGIQIPYDAPILKEISAARARKLTRIPKNFLHKVPTCLLHNMEGSEDLEWEKILKLQTPKGTFITSPSTTAFAVMETKNGDCLILINYVVEKFNGGDVFDNFKKVKKFMCYSGQAFESPSPSFNLYRASQVLFPGEKILEEAREFSYTFLKQRLASNQLLDKWLISKHLTNEIKTGLDMPCDSDWVRDSDDRKSTTGMPEINDNAYMELAKLDYNRCQSRHQMDWNHMQQ
ncbi:copal-8-ol diphosphate hydratase, chloroplastic-like [Olea europaea subsp. europaea]|uniref:Copal-8-ol diphosphate hydratase, chloroplastic-like n=1 Tax=Olea europaea subsp. europaea TaxID=158383 RepID=A0A8S0UN89_OLEEU|nr:copal-8-ol diphosphate hydratase, chloroplastic-like [Olea europaea subsp. europaea]